MVIVHMSNDERVTITGFKGEHLELKDDALRVDELDDNSVHIFRWSAVDYIESYGEKVTG